MLRTRRRPRPSDSQIENAEQEIASYSRSVKFAVTEYSFEFIVERFSSGRYYIPEYQREHRWSQPHKSRFVESVLMGLPIPFIFFWQSEDGRMEIVDGSQRIRTIRDFMADDFALSDLETLPSANGMLFSDFSAARRLKFSEHSIRVIVLDGSTDAVTRTEMFARINTGGTSANDAEIRRGSLPGPFMDLVIELSRSEKFKTLTPISRGLVAAREREELVTRFFAYFMKFDPTLLDAKGLIGDIPEYKEEPRKFYFNFVKEFNEIVANEAKQGSLDTVDKLTDAFYHMTDFVQRASPYGFTKSQNANQVPRVRFESIAVGSALALRTDPTIAARVFDISPLLSSDSFVDATRSDAANVKSKLLRRIRLTREWLLSQ